MAKIAVVISAVLFVVVYGKAGVEMDAEMVPLIMECATENSIKDITEMKDFADESRLNSHDYKCFLKCVAAKTGVTNAAGELDVAKITQKFHPNEPSLKVIAQCIETNKQEDICDRVAFAHICITKVLH